MADEPELKSTVVGIIMWLPYTILKCMHYIIAAGKDILEGHYSLKNGIYSVLSLNATYLFICLFGIGTRHLDGSFWGLFIDAFSPLILWIPNLFWAALPILILNMVLYIVVYWDASKVYPKEPLISMIDEG